MANSRDLSSRALEILIGQVRETASALAVELQKFLDEKIPFYMNEETTKKKQALVRDVLSVVDKAKMMRALDISLIFAFIDAMAKLERENRQLQLAIEKEPNAGRIAKISGDFRSRMTAISDEVVFYITSYLKLIEDRLNWYKAALEQETLTGQSEMEVQENATYALFLREYKNLLAKSDPLFFLEETAALDRLKGKDKLDYIKEQIHGIKLQRIIFDWEINRYNLPQDQAGDILLYRHRIRELRDDLYLYEQRLLLRHLITARGDKERSEGVTKAQLEDYMEWVRSVMKYHGMHYVFPVTTSIVKNVLQVTPVIRDQDDTPGINRLVKHANELLDNQARDLSTRKTSISGAMIVGSRQVRSGEEWLQTLAKMIPEYLREKDERLRDHVDQITEMRRSAGPKRKII